MKFLQWFYNPFKPHICKLNNGKYAVRKFDCTVGWYYLGNDEYQSSRKWWCVESNVLECCSIQSKEAAEERLSNYLIKNRKVKFSERVL